MLLQFHCNKFLKNTAIIAILGLKYNKKTFKILEGLDSVYSYKNIPGFSTVPKDELNAYFIQLGPATLRASACGETGVLAKQYKDVIVNSADAEYSNYIYKRVYSSQMRSVTNYHIIYHNQSLGIED